MNRDNGCALRDRGEAVPNRIGSSSAASDDLVGPKPLTGGGFLLRQHQNHPGRRRLGIRDRPFNHRYARHVKKLLGPTEAPTGSACDDNCPRFNRSSFAHRRVSLGDLGDKPRRIIATYTLGSKRG